MGITRVANVTGLDVIGIPVVMVCRPNARSLSVSQGKGLTLAAARASGLMESIELWHAERITLPLKLGSYDELRFTHRMADVDALPRRRGLFHRDLRILWVQARDVASDRGVWIPYELAHLDSTFPQPPGSGCFPLSSNGLASGNHPQEALCHAVCEAIERHAFALWERRERERQRNRVDLSSVTDPGCREVLARLEDAEVAIAAWEMTGAIGVPAFRAEIADREIDPHRPLAVCGGMGCHPSPGIALLRAVTEAAQSRLTLIAGSRDDVARNRYELEGNADRVQEWLHEVDSEGASHPFDVGAGHDGDTFEDDLAWLLERLTSVGADQVLALDLSKPGIEVPVVKVVIPGLETLPSLESTVAKPVEPAA